MGRKIPAKKHRGVKDPLVQQAKRLASLKGKINAPPKDPDEQPVPKSLTRLFAFRDPVNRKSITKKKSHTGRLQAQGNDGRPGGPGGAAHNPVSRLRKLPGESGRGFSLRINSAVKALLNPAEELQYPLDVEAEDEKGLRMSEQRERRARKRRKAERAAPAPEQEPPLTRTQKFALKKKANKMKASEAHNSRRELQYERVSFGDVAHAPPALLLSSKGAPPARPGRRDLLLTSLLAGGANTNTNNNKADVLRRERARLEAVAAYRALKAHNSRRELQYERVSFGDVAHAPPALLLSSKGAPPARPGRRDLLLTSLLAGGANTNTNNNKADVLRRERARLEAVAAYRALKASKIRNK